MTRQLCIALHDVAPATWPLCEQLLGLLDEFGRPPVTLLVVPDFHGRGRVIEAPEISCAIGRLVDRGAEVALHGYFHRDDALSPRAPWDWLKRRILTAGEGEFSALTRSEAADRIDRGWKELNDLFQPVLGFVAPAWLSNDDTWSALRESPLRYATTRHALVVLENMRRIPAQAITISARSRWRRRASRIWLRTLCRATSSAPLVRVALHPVDAQYADVMNDWRDALHMLLDQRTAMTKSQALGFA
jgi:predicted deacetylase